MNVVYVCEYRAALEAEWVPVDCSIVPHSLANCAAYLERFGGEYRVVEYVPRRVLEYRPQDDLDLAALLLSSPDNVQGVE